ncbi:uncharacterized protein LOC111902148 isoform X1 [Lactuca sativa]|uniref:uncharacterized protein LOC111902148 isoform X1 n=1 Tax=Lactuca sativa TaxID=4236 RepID=UPI001C692F04|nr:uncharacterized protein LOC111902148 isoform X1 [Lactuca sativa]
MKEVGRSKQSGTRVKKKSSSGCLVIKKKVADTVGGVSGFSDSSSRNLSRSSKVKKRRRVVESDSESSDYSSETTHKLRKRSGVYKEFETEKRASSGLDVFEFDEYDGFEDVRTRKDANGGKHRWNSYRQSGDQMESGNGGSRPTHEARTISPLEMDDDDDDFDLPLSVLSKKYRSSSDQPIRLQGENGVLNVMVNHNKQMSRSCDKKEAKARVHHKKKLDKNGDHRDAGDGHSSSSEDTRKSKEKGGMKSPTPMVLKSSKEVTESDTVTQSKSNSRVETVKKLKNVKKVKEKKNMVKHGSGTEKQILREKIKNMLLGAGWTIDYRPRKNRNYLDAIYTNPDGTAYWSIIKAYEVLQKEEEDNAEDSDNFTPLPVEILGKLARQTQKKTERELKTKRKDEGNSRNAKRAMEDTDSDYEDEMNSHGRRKSRCTLLVRDTNKVLENDGISPYSGKRTILAWLIDSGVVDVSEHVEYMNARRTRILQKGRITKDGIHCGCCSKVVTVVKFQQHSGSKLCNPFPNMFLESGKSLMQCQIDAWNKLGELEQKGFYIVDVDGDDPNDDTCSVCGDGGDLICCDGCPSTFHQSCLDIQMLPEGDWLCPNCSCKYCEMAAGNCTKDGGIGITDASLHTCCLCYKKYHESCRPGIDVKPHEPNSLDLSFCGHKCHEVYIPLRKLIGVKHELDSGFSWSLIHRSDSDSLTDGERMECNSMLAVAMSLMDECFLPFTDKRSGINLIRNVVFNCGSNLSRLNYSGFYTAILEREEEVVCAASIRFHGTQLAEMPFIGTRHIYRRQGMCRRLLSAIESALSALQVDKLIIPAVAEHMNTWTDVFGFRALEESHKQELKSMNMLVFPRTDMLQKPLLKQTIPQGKKSLVLEVDGFSALSKKPELISANVAELIDKNKNGTRDSGFQESGVPMDDTSKETLPINPPVKDESPCEPELQLQGKESDSSSKVNEIDVQNQNQNGNGTNPLPDPSHNDIPCESLSHKLQHSGNESASKIDGIAVQNGNGTNPKEGSCGSERNRKEKERVIPDLIVGNNTADADSALSKNVVELGITDSSIQEVGVFLDLDATASKEIHPISSPVKDEPQHQLLVKESDSNSKTSIETNSHVHHPIQPSNKESFSSMDVQTQGNNTIELDDHSPNVAEFTLSDKTAIIDSGSQESVVSLDDGCSLDTGKVNSPVKDEPEPQQPGKELDSIHSHSDSKVHEVDVQNGNRTNPKEGSCGSEMNRKENEKERGTLGAVSNSEATNINTNDWSGVHYSVISTPSMEVDDCSATSFSIKQEIDDKTAITDSGSQECGVLFDDTDTKTTDSGSHDNIVSSEIPDKITAAPSSEPELQLPGMESVSILSHSHSESKANEIATHNDSETDPKDEGSGLKLISSTVEELSDDTTITNSGSPIKDDEDDTLVSVSELVKTDDAHFDCNVEEHTYTYTQIPPVKITKDSAGEPTLQLPGKDSDEVAVQNGNPLPTQLHDDDAILSVSNKESFSFANNSYDMVKNGSKKSGVPLDDGCSLHASIIYTPGKGSQLQLPGKESDEIDVQNGNPRVHEQVPAASFSEPKLQLPGKESYSNSNDALNGHGDGHEPKLQQPGKESHSHSDSKVDEIDVPNGHGTNSLPLPGDVHAPPIPSDIPCQFHQLLLAAPTSNKHPGNDSDSHSDSKVGHGNPEKEIVKDTSQFFQGKEDSYESQMNRKENERGEFLEHFLIPKPETI